MTTPSYPFRLITDDQGKPTLVGASGVRYFTEETPGTWVIAVDAGTWEGWRQVAAQILATEVPGA